MVGVVSSTGLSPALGHRSGAGALDAVGSGRARAVDPASVGMAGESRSEQPPGAPAGGGAAGALPLVETGEDLRCRVAGTFYRAVDAAHRADVLAGSRGVGRYSSAGRPTLYLSSSLQGVAAAMVAHGGVESRVVLGVDVDAHAVVDLRDPAARSAAGVDLADALAPWQDVVASGGVPPSWGVRRRLEQAGAQGLVDPSRTRAGLWHLVLFAWNAPGAARVHPA